MLFNNNPVYASGIYIVSFTNTTDDGDEFIKSFSDLLFISEKWDRTLEKSATPRNDIAQGMATVALRGENKQDPLLCLFSLTTSFDPKHILPTALKYDQQTNIPVLGFVFLIDISYWKFTMRPRLFIRRDGTREDVTEGYYFVHSAKEHLQSIIDLIQGANYVIAAVPHKANKVMPLDEVREILEIGDAVKLIPCDTKNKVSTTNVLLELLKPQAQTAHIEHAIKIIERQSSE